jgi:hypothetical protein
VIVEIPIKGKPVICIYSVNQKSMVTALPYGCEESIRYREAHETE